jgi:4'-phosphopantetheinyl transferase
MNLIYSTEYNTPLANEVLQHLLTRLPFEIAAKVQRYRRWQDAYGCLFGKLLLMEALKAAGRPADLGLLQYTNYGRPYLQDAPDFNISHSGHRVVCIVAKKGRVGIDLEEIKDLNIEDFKDQFSPEEWKAINDAAGPLQAFYHYWTAKECLSKADGRGLNLPLASLKIEDGMSVRLDGRRWNLHVLSHFTNYACHVATEDPVEQMSLKEFSLNELASA